MIEPLKTFEAENDKGEVTERVKVEEVVKKINEVIIHINALEQMHNPENPKDYEKFLVKEVIPKGYCPSCGHQLAPPRIEV